MFKMDVASLNTSLIVVLILLILFLIGVYFSVNYNQTQKANILNEKANILTDKVNNMKMDCPECPNMECPQEKECPACNCPSAPECPICPKMPKQEKCPDLKCPEVNCPQLPDMRKMTNINKEPTNISCPKCPDMNCPDMNCPKCPGPKIIKDKPSQIPGKQMSEQQMPDQPKMSTQQNGIDIISSDEMTMDSMDSFSKLNNMNNNGIKPKDLLPGVGSFSKNPENCPQPPPCPVCQDCGQVKCPECPVCQKCQELKYPPVDQVIGGIFSGRSTPLLNSGSYYPLRSLSESCPIKGYGKNNQGTVLGSNDKPILPAVEQIKPNLVKPSNERPEVISPDEEIKPEEPPVEPEPTEPPVEPEPTEPPVEPPVEPTEPPIEPKDSIEEPPIEPEDSIEEPPVEGFGNMYGQTYGNIHYRKRKSAGW